MSTFVTDEAPRISLIGAPVLRDAAGAKIDGLGKKTWALLAILCRSNGRPMLRDRLAMVLWPASSETAARASLRQELSALRKALLAAGLPGLQRRAEMLCLELAPQDIDIETVYADLACDDPGVVRDALMRLGQGDLLEDIRIRSGAFDEWLWIERQQLRNAAVKAARRLLQSPGQSPGAAPDEDLARHMLRFDPTQEYLYRLLMEICVQSKRHVEALRLYRTCCAVLEQELDTVPTYETRVLAERIQRLDVDRTTKDRRWVAVFALALPPEAEIDPDHLAQAQAKLLQRVELLCSGAQIYDFADRIAVVFPADQDQAPSIAERVVDTQIGLTLDHHARPKAVLAAGIIRFGWHQPKPVLAGVAVTLASDRVGALPAGQVLVLP